MKSLTLKQQNRLRKIEAVVKGGNMGILGYLFEIEEKLEALNLGNVFEQIKGKDGESIKGDKGDRGERGYNGIDGLNGRDGEKGKDGKNGIDGKDGKDGRDGKDGLNGKDGNIKDLSPQEIRDSLELLQGNERLDKTAIKGLDEEFKDLRGKISSYGGTGGVRRVFQPYLDDFSSLTDGATKIFYLSREPLKSNAIIVWGTDFPIILRPTVDFTVSGKMLTLTDAVPAPSQGATLLIQYFA